MIKDDDRNILDGDRDEETMARLLRLAGSRPEVPPDVESRVYDRVLSAWQESTRAPDDARVYQFVRREWQKKARLDAARRWAVPVAMAASLLLALALVLQPAPDMPAKIAVGTIARVAGDSSQWDPGRSVYPGDSVTTGAGQQLSVALGNAVSLRLDENSTLVVEAAGEFRLEHGQVYADTGDFVYRDKSLRIDTPFGVVTDIGTQFAVALASDRMDVAVREGRVDIDARAGLLVAVAGERLQVRQDGATVDTLEASDSYWDWATRLAPAFDIEGKSLLEFLRWAARETGRELVFESNDVRMSAMRVDLHGSVADFDPQQALESVLAGTRFDYRIESDRIVIGAASR